jgi:hypothetical protein
MRSMIYTFLSFALFVWLPVQSAVSAEPEEEIEFLLQAIGQSGCGFNRNGKDYSSEEAEKHLRMKYNRTKSRIKTPEDFIERLASESSWTGRPYQIQCTAGDAEDSQQWLSRELDRHRMQ